jgi:hypothetical protein
MQKFALLLGSFVPVALGSTATTAALTGTQIERAAVLSMALDPDYAKSRLGVRMLGFLFAQDDVACDAIAEKLLNSNPSNHLTADAMTWYVKTLRDACAPRYHDALVLVRERSAVKKLNEHIDAALAAQDPTAPQYRADSVDLLALQIDLMQQLAGVKGSPAAARAMPLGATLGAVLQKGGMPRDLAEVTIQVARWGHQDMLAAHYDGGMLVFSRSVPARQWLLVETLRELLSVREIYDGSRFDIAQGLACLRGFDFRSYVKMRARDIRDDGGLLWVLTRRMSRIPAPTDPFEEDGMLVGVKLIAVSRHPDAVRMLREIGAAPGDRVPTLARAYAEKLGRRATQAGA